MSDTEPDDEFVDEQEKQAGAEAGAIGGRATDEPTEAELEMDESQRPLAEAGEGESEGFELAEDELEERASHGDEHSAGRVLQDAALLDESRDDDGWATAEADATATEGEADEESPPDR